MISFCEKQAGASGYPRPRLPNAALSDSGGALGNPVFEQSGHA